MKTNLVLLTLLIFLTNSLSAQFTNPDLDEWEEITTNPLSSFFNPVGWITTNIPGGILSYNPTPFISVTEEKENGINFARIESNTPGIDATMSGYIEQKITLQNLKSIVYSSRCDSINLLGRCAVIIYDSNPLLPLYTDSTAQTSGSFEEKTIIINSDWIQNTDSITIRFEAFGYNFQPQPEMEGHSVFHIEGVRTDFISKVKQTILSEHALQIYPNPSSGIINLEVEGNLKPVNIEFHDILGKKVALLPYQNQLNLNHLENGMYYISVQTEEGRVTKKITLIR